MELNNIYKGDCLNVLKEIKDKSINLICIDPPYNIKKTKWDKIDNYIEWMGSVFIECQRVLKNNGSFYWFHNDMLQIKDIMRWLEDNTEFIFNSFIIWNKGDFRSLSWKNPTEKSNLRSWFNVCEFILFYTFQDSTGLKKVKHDCNNFATLRKYFYNLLCFMGENNKSIAKRLKHRKAEHCFYVLPKKQVINIIGQKTDHCFRYDSSQWDIPTKETYTELIDVFNINEYKEFKKYEELREEYEELRYTHNLKKEHNNMWNIKSTNLGKRHVCEKPIKLIEKIIKCSSNENDIVLDCFSGSGTTGVAADNLNRNWIMIENDKTYCDISFNRINENRLKLNKPLLKKIIKQEKLFDNTND